MVYTEKENKYQLRLRIGKVLSPAESNKKYFIWQIQNKRLSDFLHCVSRKKWWRSRETWAS